MSEIGRSVTSAPYRELFLNKRKVATKRNVQFDSILANIYSQLGWASSCSAAVNESITLHKFRAAGFFIDI